jgi:hypothetical protein
LTFDLTGEDLATTEISGLWGVDNVGTIQLNGLSINIGGGTLQLPQVIADNYSTPHSFVLTNGFVAGLNTLDFIVSDNRAPAALNVSGLSTTAPYHWVGAQSGTFDIPGSATKWAWSDGATQRADAR